MTSETDTEAQTPEPFPIDLISLAEIGRLSDDEAEIILRHPRALRFLARTWDEHPPSTAMLADLVARGTSGALEVLQRAHLEHKGLRALQTAGRLAELQQIQEIAPGTVSWMSRAEGSFFISLDQDGQHQRDPFDVDVDEHEEELHVEVAVKPGVLSSDAERLVFSSRRPNSKPIACVALVYESESEESARKLQEVTSVISLPGGHTTRTVQLKHRLGPTPFFRIFSSGLLPTIPPPLPRAPIAVEAARFHDFQTRAGLPFPKRSEFKPPSGDRTRDM